MLEATKARILGARNVGGGASALGMLVDKPGDEPAESSEREFESINNNNNNTAVPQRKTKQQRRKAQKVRAEVC